MFGLIVVLTLVLDARFLPLIPGLHSNAISNVLRAKRPRASVRLRFDERHERNRRPRKTEQRPEAEGNALQGKPAELGND